MPLDKQPAWASPAKRKPVQIARRAQDLLGRPFYKPNLPARMFLKFLYSKLFPALKSYRTTIAGVGAILAGAAQGVDYLMAIADGKTPDPSQIQSAGATILVGWGLIMAKDAKVEGVPEKKDSE